MIYIILQPKTCILLSHVMAQSELLLCVFYFFTLKLGLLPEDFVFQSALYLYNNDQNEFLT